MTDVFQIEKDHTVAALNLLGAAKDAGYTIDYSGANIIDTNSGGGSHPNAGAFHVHTDWIVVNLPPPTVCLASFWIEHKAAA
jgi:hypothetical protein